MKTNNSQQAATACTSFLLHVALLHSPDRLSRRRSHTCESGSSYGKTNIAPCAAPKAMIAPGPPFPNLKYPKHQSPRPSPAVVHHECHTTSMHVWVEAVHCLNDGLVADLAVRVALLPQAIMVAMYTPAVKGSSGISDSTRLARTSLPTCVSSKQTAVEDAPWHR